MSNTRDKTRRDWIGYAIAAAATCLVLIAVAGWWLIGQRVWTDDQTIRVRDGDASVRQVLWTQPRPVDEGPAPVDKINTEADEYEPSLSPDGTELYFVRGLPGGQEHADIFVSERREGKWTAPQPVKGVNTAANELGPRLSADGALLYFYSDRAGGQGQYDLWASRRGESGWEEPFNLGPSVNSAANEFNPAPSPDGTRLFFATNRKAAGLAGHHQRWNATIRHNPSATDYDLFVAEVREGGDRGQGTGDRGQTSVSAFDAAMEVPGVNTPFHEGSASVTPANDFLYFTSNRDGADRGYDLYRVRLRPWRPGIDKDDDPSLAAGLRFGKVETVAELSTASDETDPALALEGFRLLFSSNATGGRGGYDLYVADSREVFMDRDARNLPALGWSWWMLLAAMGLLLLLLFLFSRIDSQKLGLLTRCIIASVFIHLLLTIVFSVILLSKQVYEEIVRDGPEMKIAVNLGAATELDVRMSTRSQQADLPAPTAALTQAPRSSVAMSRPLPPREIELTLPPASAAAETMAMVVPPSPKAAATEAAASPRSQIELALNIEPASSAVEAQPLRPVKAPAPQAIPASPLTAKQNPTPAAGVESAATAESKTPAAAAATKSLATAPQPRPAAPAPADATVARALSSSALPLTELTPQAAPTASSPLRVAETKPATPDADATGPVARRVTTTIADRPASEAVAPVAEVTPATIEREPVKGEPAAASAASAKAAAVKSDLAGPAVDLPNLDAPVDTAAPVKVTEATKAPPAETLPAPQKQTATRAGPAAEAAAVASAAPGASAAKPEAPSPIAAATAPRASATKASEATASSSLPSLLPELVDPIGGSAASAPVAAGEPSRAVVADRSPSLAKASSSTASSDDNRRLPASPAAKPADADHRPIARVPSAKDFSRAAPAAAIPAPPALEPLALSFALDPLAVPAPFAQRSPQLREKLLKEQGGTTESEDAVNRALAYLVRNQEPDGRWTFVQPGDKGAGKRPKYAHDMALTALSVLTFMGADHVSSKPGPYQENVSRGIDFLLRRQAKDGDLRGSEGNMYDHGIATIALAEAALMTSDPRAKEAALKAAKFIVGAQDDGSGGWRYKPGEYGDTSVLGWQIMALHSAQELGFVIDKGVRRGAGAWLDRVTQKNSLVSGYQQEGPRPSMTAEAVFTRILLGQTFSDKQLRTFNQYMFDNPPGKGEPDYYYLYYATLSFNQLQNENWPKWNEPARDYLIKMQRRGGKEDGSWNMVNRWDRKGGQVYTTCLAALTLEVYYRYLPMYGEGK